MKEITTTLRIVFICTGIYNRNLSNRLQKLLPLSQFVSNVEPARGKGHHLLWFEAGSMRGFLIGYVKPLSCYRGMNITLFCNVTPCSRVAVTKVLNEASACVFMTDPENIGSMVI
jgi:hypothetical protein